MEETLQLLNSMLRETLRLLEGPLHSSLQSVLHDDSKLPDKKISQLASSSIDLLHKTEQLLEPPSLVLADHFLGYVNPKCLSAAVDLNIPDILHEKGPLLLAQLAEAANARPDRLSQILRVLYNNNIFSYSPSTKLYSNNAASTLLISSHWTQWRNWVDLYGDKFYDAAKGIPASCKSGETRMAAQIHFDTNLDMFAYFQQQGWVPKLHRTLSGGAIAQAPGILEDYPWEEMADCSGPGIFLDVGGGGGGLVASILRKHTTMRAAVLDTERVIEQAKANFHLPDGQYFDVGERVLSENLIVGDFLKEIPTFEVYTMKWCLHDWDDSKAIKVLSNIRRSIIRGPKSRLIVLESLLTDGRMGRLSRYGDITMMMSANGQERTKQDWRELASKTGWTVSKIYQLRNAWVCAVEMLPVWSDESNGNGVNQAEPQLASAKQIAAKDITNGVKGVDLTGQEQMQNPNARNISTEMTFLEPWEASRGRPYVRMSPDEGFSRTNIQWIKYPVTIMDARPHKIEFQLETHGFKFVDSPALNPDILEAFRLDAKILLLDEYYAHIKDLVMKETRANKVVIFDHTVRKRSPDLDVTANPEGKEQPATMVHCDQSTKGAHRRIKQCLGENEELGQVLSRRVQMINIWRPLRGPVIDWPLAVMDARSVSAKDVFPVDLLKHKFEERGQTVAVCHHPEQKWWYLSGHRTDEVTMIKIWDNNEYISGKFCPHAAFRDPDTPQDALPRESVEFRCIVFMD